MFTCCADGDFLSSWVVSSFQRRTVLRAAVCKIISRAFDDAVPTNDVILPFEVLVVNDTMGRGTRFCLSHATVYPVFILKDQELFETPCISIGTVCFNS